MSLTLAIITLFILFLINIPISYSLMASTLIYFLTSDLTPMILVQRMIGGIESIPLLAVPFFVTAGVLMNYTGISKRMVNFAEVMTGHLPGGLAQVNVLLSTLMGGLSGSSIADAAMQSKILVPEMVKRGYSKAFSSAVTGASALITPIIPPGIALIIYGYVGNVSIGRLFLAGILPGVLMCVILMLTVHFISKKRGYLPARDKAARPKEVLIASRDAFLALLLPVVIIGGIRFGIFTPTEAGSIAVIYALFLGAIVYREMKINHLKEALYESVSTTTSILLIIAAASSFAWVLTWERVPHIATEFVTSLVHSPSMFLLVVNIFLLIIGMFIEGNVALIILTPLLMPMVKVYGIDPVHFGMIFIFNLSVGTLTPPLGTIMFTTCSITGTKIADFLKEIIPFYIVLAICLILITYLPIISLWLPSVLM
ncbi:MAG: TRAP transporter large permease [Bacillota bacterium]|nr:TRAP transporter large permease [Bacillota bacterium]